MSSTGNPSIDRASRHPTKGGLVRIAGGAAFVCAFAASLVAGATAARVTYPGSNGLIVFARDKPPCSETAGCNSVIATMRADGSGERRLTKGPHDQNPAWSPDGKQIAFVHFRGIGIPAIDVMNADGSGRKELVDGGLVRVGDYLLDWLDNQRIVFTGRNADRPKACFSGRPPFPLACFQVVLSTVDVGNRAVKRLLTFPAVKAGRQFLGPSTWAIHGSKVAYVLPDFNIRSVKPGGLFVMNIDGSGKRRVTRGPPLQPRDICAQVPPEQECPTFGIAGTEGIDWSPNGSSIVFTAELSFPCPTEACADSGFQLFVAHVASGAFSKVPGNPWLASPGSGDAGEINDPTWSPDGTKLLFRTEIQPGGTGFTIIPEAGGGGIAISGNPGECTGTAETPVLCGGVAGRWQPRR